MKLDVDNLIISSHAYSRALERLQLKSSKTSYVNKHIKKELSKSEYIGKVANNEGDNCELFIYRNTGYYISSDFKTVITVIKHNRMSSPYFHDKVRPLAVKEFNKLDRSERSKMKKLEVYKLEAEIEAAELKLRIHKTKSISVKLACQGRIEALKTSIVDLENDIVQIKSNKKQVANILASVI